MFIRIFLSFLITPLLYAIVLPTSLSAQLTDTPQVVVEGEMTLHSVYLIPPVNTAHQIILKGELGGKALLILDSNACMLDQFGDVTVCTQMYPPRYNVQMTQLRIADPKGLGRSLYRLRGEFPDESNEYFLVSPPTGGSLFRLLIVNIADQTTHVIPLEIKKVSNQ